MISKFINSYFDIYNKRREQLEKQKIIDEKFVTLSCKDKVITFLLEERRINRMQSVKQSELSFTELPSFLYKNMEEIDKRYNYILKLLESDEFCHN
jgi:hypothetical protein